MQHCFDLLDKKKLKLYDIFMKTVLITGASRGIGAEIAKTFASKKYNIVINYNKSESQAVSLAKELEKNTRVLCIKADVANMNEVEEMYKKIKSTFGTVDVLVNNAGVSLNKLLIDTTYEEWQNVLNTNVGGIFNTCKTFCTDMISNKNGKIINISSIWGNCGACMESAYSASKGAVIAFTKALAKELASSNINVNCICPGIIKTDMLNCLDKNDLEELRLLTPLNRLGVPKDVANLVYFLASEESEFITGQIITVDGGFAL